jgi:uncharacterized membrane protein
MPLAVLLSASLQLSFISRSSIWHDEGYSLWLIKYDYADIFVRTARDVHPPLYYLALKAWTSIFGTSELAARSFSTACIAGIIILSYLLVKKLFGLGAARVTALFLAFAPFLIRYGQEARMYSLVALLLTAATYTLVCALNSKSRRLLFVYSLLMALAFYTHYYAVFMVPVHWLYVLSRTHWHKSQRIKGEFSLLSPWWWIANAVIVMLFIPWLPSAVGQFSRVQGGFWIPPVSIGTLPATTGQMLQYTDLSSYPISLRLASLMGLVALTITSVITNVKQRASLVLISAWAAVAPLSVFAISLVARPVYVDRYFVYAAVGFYVLLAVMLYVRPLNYLYKIRPVLICLVIALFSYGIRNVYLQSNHKMSEIGNLTNSQFTPGDLLLSGELYTYLDFSYYNRTNQPVYLLSPSGVSGYGETSLIYDHPELVIRNYHTVSNKRVWLVGKVGDKEYYRSVPSNWKLKKTVRAKDSEVRLYEQP